MRAVNAMHLNGEQARGAGTTGAGVISVQNVQAYPRKARNGTRR